MPRPRTLAVLFTGNTVDNVKAQHGDFDQQFRTAIGDAWDGAWMTYDARTMIRPLPLPSDFDAVIVTGSSSSVTERAPWMERLEFLLRTLVERETPLLGVCFGHQILASALGGEVRRNPVGRRIGPSEVEVVADDPLFEGLPKRFSINVSHQDHVAVRPPKTTLLATAPHDDFHTFAAGPRARGVQFHPEFHNDIMRGYLHARREILAAEQIDADERIAAIVDVPAGPQILRNFVRNFAHTR